MVVCEQNPHQTAPLVVTLFSARRLLLGLGVIVSISLVIWLVTVTSTATRVPAGRLLDREVGADRVGTLAHPDQAVVLAGDVAGLEPDAVVDDLEPGEVVVRRPSAR